MLTRLAGKPGNRIIHLTEIALKALRSIAPRFEKENPWMIQAAKGRNPSQAAGDRDLLAAMQRDTDQRLAIENAAMDAMLAAAEN